MLRALKELNQFFFLMSTRFRNIMIKLKEKKKLKKSSSQNLYKVFQYCFLHCEAQLYLLFVYISDSDEIILWNFSKLQKTFVR